PGVDDAVGRLKGVKTGDDGPLGPAAEGEGHTIPIAEFGGGGMHDGFRQLRAPPDPAERLEDRRTAQVELGVVPQVLEGAAAAAGVHGTGRVATIRAPPQEVDRPPPGPPGAARDEFDSDAIPGSR